MLDRHTVAGIDAVQHILSTTPLQGHVLRLFEWLLRLTRRLAGLRPEITPAEPEERSQVGEAGGGDSHRRFDAGPHDEWDLVILDCQYYLTRESITSGVKTHR